MDLAKLIQLLILKMLVITLLNLIPQSLHSRPSLLRYLPLKFHHMKGHPLYLNEGCPRLEAILYRVG